MYEAMIVERDAAIAKLRELQHEYEQCMEREKARPVESWASLMLAADQRDEARTQLGKIRDLAVGWNDRLLNDPDSMTKTERTMLEECYDELHLLTKDKERT